MTEGRPAGRPAKAVIKNGELLLPHDAGCGAELITPDDPRYPALHADAVRDEDLQNRPERSSALAARWRRKWALDERRTA